MISRQFLRLKNCMILGALLLSACTNATPNVTVPVFHGRLIVKREKGIYQVAHDEKTGQIAMSLITTLDTSDFWIRTSPDRRYLLYRVDSGGAGPFTSTLGLLDLQTKETNTIATESSTSPTIFSCLSWAPNSEMVSYLLISNSVRYSLYAYSLASKTSTPVFEAPSSKYSVMGYGEGSEFSSKIDCGGWIGADRLVFQRYVGELPHAITSPGFHELDPNTTTLATLDKPGSLVDSPERWLYADTCVDNSYILLEDINHDTFIAPSFSNLESVQPRLLPVCPDSDCIGWLFRPDICQLYAVKVEHEAPRVVRGLYLTDPETLQIYGPILSSSPYSPPYLEWYQWIWIGDSSDMVIPGVIFENGNNAIFVIDMNNGNRNKLLDIEGSATVEFVAWLP